MDRRQCPAKTKRATACPNPAVQPAGLGVFVCMPHHRHGWIPFVLQHEPDPRIVARQRAVLGEEEV